VSVANWELVETEFITGDISYRKLAEKHSVSFNTLKSKASRDNWAKRKKDFKKGITTKIIKDTTELTTKAGMDTTKELISALEEQIQELKDTYPAMIKNLNHARTYAEIIEKITKTICLLTGKPTEINKNLNENQALNLQLTHNELNIIEGVITKEKERLDSVGTE
jgi:DNA repair exonuclease SbcCD ATPase subunit